MRREGRPLEDDLQSELNLPWRTDDRGDLSGSSIYASATRIRRSQEVRKERGAWQSQIRVIQDVEEFSTKLGVDALRDPGVLGHGEIQICIMRAADRIASQVPKSSRGFDRKCG